MNLQPSGYEPDELPGCSTARMDKERVELSFPSKLGVLVFPCENTIPEGHRYTICPAMGKERVERSTGSSALRLTAAALIYSCEHTILADSVELLAL